MQDVHIILDSDEMKKQKSNNIYRYNLFQIPTLRFAGLLILVIILIIHNVSSSDSPHWKEGFTFLLITICYCSFSWVILYFLFEKIDRVNLGDIFLMLDPVFIILAIYWFGNIDSILIFLLTARVADQVYTSFKRVLFFSHYIVLCYLVLLFYLFYIDQRPIDWIHESIKMVIVYLFSIYISLTARSFMKTRSIKNSAIKRAKNELIHRLKAETELREKNRQLQEALEEINVLRGIHPICSFCKKIRDDKGVWNHIETYIKDRSDATFSHSVCPNCAEEHYPDLG